jgi:hypothetical protein
MDSPNPGSDGSMIDVEPRLTRRTRGRLAASASQSAPATDGDDDTEGAGAGGGTSDQGGPSDDDGDDFGAVRRPSWRAVGQ